MLHDVTTETFGKPLPQRLLPAHHARDELILVFNESRQAQIAKVGWQENDAGTESRQAAGGIQNFLLRRSVHPFIDFRLNAVAEKTGLKNGNQQAGSAGAEHSDPAFTQMQAALRDNSLDEPFRASIESVLGPLFQGPLQLPRCLVPAAGLTGRARRREQLHGIVIISLLL